MLNCFSCLTISRWENEIKKNIPKPDCLSKNIENCTEDELEIIRAYENAVNNLNNERLKYKLFLEKKTLHVQGLYLSISN